MTKKTIVLISLITVPFILAACKSASGKVMPYAFDTAKIEYKISGDVTGTMVSYFKGDLAVHRMEATSKDKNEPVKTLTLDLGDKIYVVDLVKNEGFSSKNYIYDELKNLSTEQKVEKLARFATDTNTDGETLTKAEQRDIAGQKCDVYKVADKGEICLWQGIPLQSKISYQGSERDVEAQTVTLGVQVADSEFQIPEGITIQDIQSAG